MKKENIFKQNLIESELLKSSLKMLYKCDEERFLNILNNESFILNNSLANKNNADSDEVFFVKCCRKFNRRKKLFTQEAQDKIDEFASLYNRSLYENEISVIKQLSITIWTSFAAFIKDVDDYFDARLQCVYDYDKNLSNELKDEMTRFRRDFAKYVNNLDYCFYDCDNIYRNFSINENRANVVEAIKQVKDFIATLKAKFSQEFKKNEWLNEALSDIDDFANKMLKRAQYRLIDNTINFDWAYDNNKVERTSYFKEREI